MFHVDEKRSGITEAIYGLWRSWAVAVGALTLLAVLAPIIPRVYIAPLNIAIYLLLQFFHVRMRRNRIPTCGRLLQQVSTVIIVLAAAMIVVTFLYPSGTELNGQEFDRNSPFISILAAAPLAAVVTLFFTFSSAEPRVCRQCRVRYGSIVTSGFVKQLFTKEWRYQTILLFALSLFISIVDWVYYLLHYINTNLNRADHFFFIWLPLAVYVLSLIYLGMRYHSLWVYYCRNDEAKIISQTPKTELRFLVIQGDKILLAPVMHDEAPTLELDTPVSVTESYHEAPSQLTALNSFKKYTGLPVETLRFAYESPDLITYRNTFHYIAVVKPDADVSAAKVSGEWFSWGAAMQLAQNGLLCIPLINELKRIYHIAMAWKTYSINGKRLYPIRHYKPTFRLRDLPKWDVDYNDARWLRVARFNEDKMWYPLAKFFLRSQPVGNNE